MSLAVRNIVILGGGTAGWMSASYLKTALGDSVNVAVLEAPGIPRIGVGEATVPNLQRVFFDFLGIPEETWMRECNASYKMAVKFINWNTPGPGQVHPRATPTGPDRFYHPFGILPTIAYKPLSHYWVDRAFRGETSERFDFACFLEPHLMERKLAPRDSSGQQVANYAWHFDAQLVADFLCRFSVANLGVVHIREKMVSAERDANGYITALVTETGRQLAGDLFVDCSGFKGVLINELLGEPFRDDSDSLLCDRAIACPIPANDERDGIEPYTSAIAMPAGWVWKTPMLGRFGTGYVYSSRHVGDDAATQAFCDMWKIDPEGSFNRVPFRVGRNSRSWVKNCVSIGLSSCFLEPLESSGLYFTYAAIYQLAQHFPDKTFDSRLRDAFNTAVAEMYDETKDFVQAHFALSPRRDTPFWRDNASLSLSDSFSDKLTRYKAGLPVNPPISDEATYYSNFDAEFKNFWTNGSYYAILTGLGVLPDSSLPALRERDDWAQQARRIFDEISEKAENMHTTTPSCFSALRELHGR